MLKKTILSSKGVMRCAQTADYDAVFIGGNGVRLFVDKPCSIWVEVSQEEDYKLF